MSECSHDCSSCSSNCSSRTQEKTDFLEPLYRESKVKKVIGIVSGKGGVGKSMTTSLLGVAAMRKGLHTAILDADVTGPSIPQAFGLHERLLGNAEGIILPAMTNFGIEVVSLNLMLEEETQPVIWRGPVVADVVKQFWGKTLWKDIDVMFVDMPPGTGEVPLTVFQSIPLDGIVVVATPQELVGMIVEKAVNMANMMNVPVLGLIENMSYIKCPDCGKEIKVFGDSHIEEISEKFDIPVLGKLPIDPKLTEACDAGLIEDVENIHKKMETLLGKEGVFLDDVFYCPHHPDKGYPEENPAYKIPCECRKPKTGMIQKAAERYNIDLAGSWMIGDTTMDIQTGINAGIRTALVLTGEAGNDKKYDVKPELVCRDLLDAVEKILQMD